MKISAKADYAVRAALELARLQPEKKHLKGDAISRQQGIPIKFLENILLDLRRSGIVKSQRGAEGGYWLARPADEVTMADVIRAVDGPLAYVRGERPEEVLYENAAAALPRVWVALRASIRTVLESVTLADIVADELPDLVTELLANPEAWSPH